MYYVKVSSVNFESTVMALISTEDISQYRRSEHGANNTNWVVGWIPAWAIHFRLGLDDPLGVPSNSEDSVVLWNFTLFFVLGHPPLPCYIKTYSDRICQLKNTFLYSFGQWRWKCLRSLSSLFLLRMENFWLQACLDKTLNFPLHMKPGMLAALGIPALTCCLRANVDRQ